MQDCVAAFKRSPPDKHVIYWLQKDSLARLNPRLYSCNLWMLSIFAVVRFILGIKMHLTTVSTRLRSTKCWTIKLLSLSFAPIVNALFCSMLNVSKRMSSGSSSAVEYRGSIQRSQRSVAPNKLRMWAMQKSSSWNLFFNKVRSP